ncbi:ricin-like [Mercurialis annua]|uniref:ricin-like n=1 Tax=Mercurialis annua TaxID=3986 RepID=UPI002160AC9B|nr:ricin-like [Mercurialis annua]
MKGKNSLLWICYVTSAWLWWSSVAFESALEESSSLSKPNEKFLNWYRQNIQILRRQAGNSADLRHGIPVLFHKGNLPKDGRFFTLTMDATYTGGKFSVKVVLDKTNVRIVAFVVNAKGFIFSDDNLNDAAAVDAYVRKISTQRQLMPFINSYSVLEQLCGVKRGQVVLGYGPLIDAVNWLYSYSTNATQVAPLAGSMIVINQMITESGRFREIELLMQQAIRYDRVVLTHPTMVSLEDNWEAISGAVQKSGKQGTFTAIQILRYKNIPIDNVRRLMGVLSLLLFKCDALRFSPVIRSVVPSVDEGGVCGNAEQTVYLVGRNNLCVNLNGSRVNSVQCGNDLQQKWTLKRDSTIRSNDMCLTTKVGNVVTIYNCAGSATISDAARWNLTDDGTIINSKSGLVLSVTAAGDDITVQKNSYAASQGWLATTDAEPFVAPILGLRELCLQSNGSNVFVNTCENREIGQIWAFYGDGSIRPYANQGECLTTDGTKRSIVKIVSCSPASSGQRWLLKNDGAIWNLYYGFVLDVESGDPKRKRIIGWPYNGRDNQKWVIWM